MNFLIKASQQLYIVRYYPLVTPEETKEQRRKTGEFIMKKKEREGDREKC